MNETERDAARIGKQLSVLGQKYIDPAVRAKILGRAAQPVQSAVKAKAPVWRGGVHASLDGAKRPGTLRNSVQIFRARNDKSVGAVLVGNVLKSNARISKVQGQTLSKARGKRAYYASILLAKRQRTWRPFGGTRNQKQKQAYDYIEEGYNAAKTQASAIIVREGTAILNDWKRAHGL